VREVLTRLLKVKTIVTFAVIAVFCCLALTEKIRPEDVMLVVTTVVAFYFGSQNGKNE